uniref:Ras-related protein Rab-39B-like n=1 Tax=Phallusia mammillata TaxID=59560 RepID=A0A6F9DQV5_9ASCI|nr:ras-related protein Rab-39B-like [Phallusia mammillata]
MDCVLMQSSKLPEWFLFTEMLLFLLLFSMGDLIANSDTIWVYQFRIVLLGDSTVGKSALIRRFTDGCFLEASDPTVGVDFYSRLVEIAPSTRVKLQVWDTAGQERFRSITQSYYRNSVGAILVYDVANRDSFEHVSSWAEEARLHVAPRPISFVLVGQKCDLENERKVSTEEASAFARMHKMLFVETSAKQGLNVDHSFLLLTELIYRMVKSGELRPEDGWEGIKCGLVPPQTQIDEDYLPTKRGCCY